MYSNERKREEALKGVVRNTSLRAFSIQILVVARDSGLGHVARLINQCLRQVMTKHRIICYGDMIIYLYRIRFTIFKPVRDSERDFAHSNCYIVH